MAPALGRAAWRGAAALALLAGACGHGGAGTRTGGDVAVGQNLASTTTSVPQPGGSTATTRASRPGGSTITTTTVRGQTPATVRGGTNSPPDTTISRAARRSPGQFAGVLLAPGAARTLIVDVRVEPGAAANGGAIDAVAQILREQSGKSVMVHGPTPLTDSAQTHDADAIRRLADTQGEAATSDAAVMHLFYLSGQFSQNGVLGVTVRADTVAVFPDEIRSATSPLVSEARLERAVATHELGHVLGLVDLYLDDNREDPAHPGHSPNQRSVMYWAVESDVVSQVLDGPPPVDFDSADLADLRKIHAGAAAQV